MQIKNYFLLLLLLSAAVVLSAQSANQTLRGTITDQATEGPLAGATVILQGTNPLLGGLTDSAGKYVIENVPVGRYTLQAQYTGYKVATVPELLVTSGKQVVADVSLNELVTNIKAVEITAGNNKKDAANNEFATISARNFSMDEVGRYSGGRNDIARMVTGFAGVAASNDSRNDIIVRGNSPTGILWMVEGIPVPNPNQFSVLGSTGGPVSALNPNVLRNSDFLTGAFPAQYGNADAGVFDVAFRNGNTNRHEFTFQLGAFSGLEAMAEGPLNKAGTGSYLVAYRYSFAGIGSKLGIPIGTKAAPQYNDLNFKIDLPATKKAGKFSLFGIGAYSFIDFIGKNLTDADIYNGFPNPNQDNYPRSGFGIIGLKHSITAGHDAYVKTIFSISTEESTYTAYQDSASGARRMYNDGRDLKQSIRLASYYNKRFNRHFVLRAGGVAELHVLNSAFKSQEFTPNWVYLYNFKGAVALIQPYAQLQYKILDNLTLNTGLHGQAFTLNGSWSIEPRASLNYEFLRGQSINLAYGWHSQLQPLPTYFSDGPQADGTYNYGNRQLGFTRSHHIVLAYDLHFKSDWHFKIEPYAQFITNAPISVAPNSFSMLNAGADFSFPDSINLVNKGLGRNIGVEITLEKFFSKGYYGLFTASIFDSRYRGSDGVWRNTVFNSHDIINLLLGKEFKVGQLKRNAITTDLKLSTSGGKWFTPINLTASQFAGTQITDNTLAYTQQYPQYVRLDVKVGFRLNSKKSHVSNTFFLDFQNVTFRKNVFETAYNPLTRSIQNVNQLGFFPDVLYRLQF